MTRKLNAGEVITRVFELYGRAANVLLPTAAIIYLVVGLITATALSSPGTVVFVLVAALFAVAGLFWYHGLVVEVVRELRVSGEIQPVGSLFAAVRPRFWALLGIGILAGIAIGIGFLIFIVPGVILFTMWALIIPVLIVERGPAMDAFGRSRELVRGNFWHVFSVIVVVFFITYLVQQAARAASGTSFVALLLDTLIPYTLLAPISGLAASIMYFDLRELRGELAPGQAPYGPPDPGGAVPPPAPTPATADPTPQGPEPGPESDPPVGTM